jgi:hypothetical protein
MEARLRDLVEAGDMNGLLRAVDGLCASRSWDDLVELADHCEEAVERGKQLWPIAAHIDYRIALEAPPEFVGEVIDSDLGRFAPGPLTEVAGSAHEWNELAPHLQTPQTAAYVAQERVLRGERLDGDERAHAEVVELPLHLEQWEPPYTLARYGPDYVEVTDPWLAVRPNHWTSGDPGDELDEPELLEPLLDLVQPWTAESNGAARAVVVEGAAANAVARLTLGPFRADPIEADDALRRMAWAAASGGAHGRRRGAAYGRSAAWFALAALTDVAWPPDADELGSALGRLEWFLWDEGEAEKGWVLRLAAHDRVDGWAVAIGATDLVTEDEEDADS